MPRLVTAANRMASVKAWPTLRCSRVPFGVNTTHSMAAMATTQAAVWNHPKTDIDRFMTPPTLDELYTLQCRVFCQPLFLCRGTRERGPSADPGLVPGEEPMVERESPRLGA